jgi:CRP/FNR family transcriptional regulator, cyclic AMP receptor protein
MDEEEVVGDRIVHSLVSALRNVPEFGGLDERTQLRVVGASANLFWPEGSTIFQRGAPAEALYIVLKGAVAVVDETDGREVEAARIGPGDYFGEMSLLLHTTHTKSARAAEDTELMVVPKESFQALLSSTPELAEHFRRKIERRMPGGAPGSGLDVESTDDASVPSAERTDG